MYLKKNKKRTNKELCRGESDCDLYGCQRGDRLGPCKDFDVLTDTVVCVCSTDLTCQRYQHQMRTVRPGFILETVAKVLQNIRNVGDGSRQFF